MNPTPDEHGEFSDSDQQWFDRLSGKPVAAGDSQALREADALKRALELEREAAGADPSLAAADAPGARERRWQRLQFRLRREGALDGGAGSATRRRWLPAAAAAMLVIAIGAWWLPGVWDDGRSDYDQPPTWRGEFQLVQRQEARPKEAAEALAAALRSAGLAPRLYQRGTTYSIDLEVPAEPSAEALRALAQARLAAQAGRLRVEIGPR